MKDARFEIKKLKKRLDRKPRIPGINGPFDFKFLDKRSGKKDAQENQICGKEKGHITPHVDNKIRLLDSYVNGIYLKTSLNLEPLISEASSMVVEFNLLSQPKKDEISVSNTEIAQRQAASEVADVSKKEIRKKEILTKIAEIKAGCDMIDESLKHHVECADAVCCSRISRYWKGILSASGEKLEVFPYLEQRVYEGRETYLSNRRKLIEMIVKTLVVGGGYCEE